MERKDIYVYKPEDIARMLGIGRSSVYKLLRTGEIKSKRIGKLYRIPPAFLEEYLAGDDEKDISAYCVKGGD